MEALIDTTARLISTARSRLRSLPRAQGTEPVKVVTQKALARKLMDAAGAYQEIQKAAKKQYKNQLVRQIRIVSPDATTEQIDQAVQGYSNFNLHQQRCLCVVSLSEPDQRWTHARKPRNPATRPGKDREKSDRVIRAHAGDANLARDPTDFCQ